MGQSFQLALVFLLILIEGRQKDFYRLMNEICNTFYEPTKRTGFQTITWIFQLETYRVSKKMVQKET